MERLRVAYALSLGVLALLIVFVVYFAMPRQGSSSIEPSGVVAKADFIELEDRSVIQIAISNYGGYDTIFLIQIRDDGKLVAQHPVLIRDGKFFSYRRYVYPGVEDRNVTINIYRGNETEPMKEFGYLIKGRGAT